MGIPRDSRPRVRADLPSPRLSSTDPENAGVPAFRADLARTLRLFRAFRREQSDPDHFYGMLARDTVSQLAAFADLAGAVVVDVGGGPGYFARHLAGAGARPVCVDNDLAEMAARGSVPAGAVLGSALDLPLRTGSVDVCFSSNVLEHVSDPVRTADEMVRVTRPGGTIYLAFTNWLSPWGGHETSPWHYLGGHRAARRYASRHGRAPKNRFGENLHPVSVARMLGWARERERGGAVRVLDARPRYLPGWAKPVVRLPGVREVVTWNLALVLRRR